MILRFILGLTVLALCLPASAKASDGDFIDWQSTNVQLLRGNNYKLGSKSRTIVTVEHANSWQYGDFFVFGDQIWQDGGTSSFYIEPTLRLSLNKMSGRKPGQGLIKDVYLSGQVEFPEHQKARWLVGASVDLNLPAFRFFKTNLFLRDNPALAGSTYQATVAWNLPFEYGRTKFLTEGFADIVGTEGTASAYELIVPRLLMDVGHKAGFTANKVWMGVEWQHWRNKFGVDGVTESAAQLQLKYVF